MTVDNLIKQLKKLNPLAKVLVSSDEELNTLFNRFEVTNLEDDTQVVIYGLSGSEEEINYD
jgi:predicted P-loop ATPase/GTPase